MSSVFSLHKKESFINPSFADTGPDNPEAIAFETPDTPESIIAQEVLEQAMSQIAIAEELGAIKPGDSFEVPITPTAAEIPAPDMRAALSLIRKDPSEPLLVSIDNQPGKETAHFQYL